jgi:hypothetical protein
MKNTLLILLFISSIISCTSKTTTESIDKTNSKRPSQAITYKEMASMFKAYDKGQRKVLNKFIKKKSKGKDTIATLSEFFTISELKQYIAYVERLSAEKEIELTGIRIFTSAYPSNYKIPEYRNRVTFMLAPTAKINGRDVAYEPLKSGIKKPVSMMSVLRKYADSTTIKVNRASLFPMLGDEDEESSGMNRGQIDPPY